MKKPKVQKLPLRMQHYTLRAMMEGYLGKEGLVDGNFDPDERIIFNAIQHLLTVSQIEPPIPITAIVEQVRLIQGKVHLPETVEVVLNHIKDLEDINGSAIEGLRRSISIRGGLTTVLDDITSQLSSGAYDIPSLVEQLHVVGRDERTSGVSVSEYLFSEEHDTGKVVSCNSLPQLMELTGGIRGLWVIAGAPGYGKSTIIIQMLLDLAHQGTKIHWFNFELDKRAVRDRIKQGWPLERDALHAISERIIEHPRAAAKYIRNIAMDQHAESPDEPAVFIIDTFQKLPVKTNFARSGYDSWLHDFEAISLEYGYPFILASQKDRSSYDQATLRGFKETGEIESTMTVGIQIIPMEVPLGSLSLHIVKNRHRKYTGHCLDLHRHNDWWFKEQPLFKGVV